MSLPDDPRGPAAEGPAAGPADTATSAIATLLALPPDADVLAELQHVAERAPGGAAALVEVLSASRDPRAGRILGPIAAGAPSKDLRKAARRGLHRLRSLGIEVEVPVSYSLVATARPPAMDAHVTSAQATMVDGVGSRILWLTVERPGGGITTFALVLNDVVGIKDAVIEETTRRRFERELTTWREEREATIVTLPVAYGLSLAAEGLALNATSHTPVPRDFVLRRHLLGELPPPPSDALIHQRVSRGQTFLMPNLLDESARLLEEREMTGWFFGYDESKQYAHELQKVRESRLVLSLEPRETREQRIVDSAVDGLFTPQQRRAFRRRLEETAYLFWETGRERSAREAVAAAFAINDSGSLRSHPLLRAIVEKSLELALEAEAHGPPPPEFSRRPSDPI